MAISLKHLFTSAKADGADPTLIKPSDWNSEHVLTLATGKVVGRKSAGAGVAEELSGSDLASMINLSSYATAAQINAATDAAFADDTYLTGRDTTTGNLFKRSWANVKSAIFTALGPAVHALPAKSTLAAADEFLLLDSATAFATSRGTLTSLNALLSGMTPYEGGMINGQLVPTVAANALTVALKTKAGNDPSATDPVYVVFRDPTAANGDYVVITVTSAKSIVVPAGASLGTVGNQAGRVWVVGFNNGGAFQLGVVTTYDGAHSVMALSDDILASASAIGAGSTNAQTIYSTSAVTAKPMRLLGYLDVLETTAGTWATAPSKTQLFGPGVHKPGDRVQIARTEDGSASFGTTHLDYSRLPTNVDGNQFMQRAITPVSAANMLRVRHSGIYASSGTNGEIGCALFLAGASNAIASGMAGYQGSNAGGSCWVEWSGPAASTSPQTFSVRAGTANGNCYFNRSGSVSPMFGGTGASFLEAEEIMA